MHRHQVTFAEHACSDYCIDIRGTLDDIGLAQNNLVAFYGFLGIV